MNRVSRRQAITVGALAGVAGVSAPVTGKGAAYASALPQSAVMVGQVRRAHFEPAKGKERTEVVRIPVAGRPQSAVAFLSGFDIGSSDKTAQPIHALSVSLGPCRCEGDQVEVPVRIALRGDPKANAAYGGWADVACIAW